MNDDDLTILPTVFKLVVNFGRGQIRLPRARVRKLAIAALDYLARHEPEQLAEVLAPYLPKQRRTH